MSFKFYPCEQTTYKSITTLLNTATGVGVQYGAELLAHITPGGKVAQKAVAYGLPAVAQSIFALLGKKVENAKANDEGRDEELAVTPYRITASQGVILPSVDSDATVCCGLWKAREEEQTLFNVKELSVTATRFKDLGQFVVTIITSIGVDLLCTSFITDNAWLLLLLPAFSAALVGSAIYPAIEQNCCDDRSYIPSLSHGIN